MLPTLDDGTDIAAPVALDLLNFEFKLLVALTVVVLAPFIFIIPPGAAIREEAAEPTFLFAGEDFDVVAGEPEREDEAEVTFLIFPGAAPERADLIL